MVIWLILHNNTQSLDPRTSSNEEAIKDPGYYAGCSSPLPKIFWWGMVTPILCNAQLEPVTF